MALKFKTCCCCIKLEHGIYLIGGADLFFLIVGIIEIIFLIMTRDEPEERQRTSKHRPEEVTEGISPFVFELPRLIAFLFLVCRAEHNRRARKIYYIV